MIWKIGFSIGGVIIVLLGILVGRTLLGGPPSLDPVPTADVVSVDVNGTIRRLSEAVQIRTVSHGNNAPAEGQAFRDFHALLSRSFPMVHKTFRRETVNDFSLLYTWEGSDPELQPMLLTAHSDVVPVETGTEQDWRHPPFDGVIADGFVWGRGTLDVKQALMGMLEAAEILVAEGFQPERTVYLAFGHDEEVGGNGGAASVTRLLQERGQRLAFTLDEGLAITHGIVPGVDKPTALIGLAEKGFANFEIAAKGAGGHSSRPPSRTSIGRLGAALHRIETNPMPAELRKPVSELFGYISREMSFPMRLVFSNRWLFDPLLLNKLGSKPVTNAVIRTTIAPTLIRGGIKANILAQSATATVNVRLLPGDTLDAVEHHLKSSIDDPSVSVRRLGTGAREASPVADAESASFAVLRRTILETFPEVVVAPGLVIGGTDSKHYSKVADNSFRFVPMRLAREDLKRIHGTNERISVENYGEIIRFYIQLIRNTAVETNR